MRFTDRKTLFTHCIPLLSIPSICTDRHMTATVRVYWTTLDYFDHHILRESKIFLETTVDDLFNYSRQVLCNVPLGVAMLLAMRWAFFGRSSNDVTGITSSDLATGTSVCVPTGTT